MKPSFTRRFRRRSKPAKSDGAFFKKEGSAEHSFFGEAAHDAFFQPAVSNDHTVQRKCADCEKEDKKVQRAAMENKKEDDDKKLQRAPEKKEEEDKQLMRTPEKKEEEKKKQWVTEKKKEEDKQLQRTAEKKEEDKKLQRKESAAASSVSSVSNYIGSLNGKGQAMPPLANQFFADRMGYDFSDVKVHTGKDAAESASNVNAKAYTVGNNIVFNEGQYDTSSQEGKRLLAHELTHVVQHGGAEQMPHDSDTSKND